MKKADYILLVSTFLLGAFVGGYLYVTAYKPSMEEQLDVFTELDWEIIARETGPCEVVSDCAELYLASNRQYKHFAGGEELSAGALSRALRNELSAILEATAADRPFDSVCHLHTTNKSYFYDIEAYDTRWQSATCDEDFANTELDDLLDAAWYEARTGEKGIETDTIFDKGFYNWLKDELDKRFQYDD